MLYGRKGYLIFSHPHTWMFSSTKTCVSKSQTHHSGIWDDQVDQVVKVVWSMCIVEEKYTKDSDYWLLIKFPGFSIVWWPVDNFR